MNIIVLIGGSGTNLQALIDSQKEEPEHKIVAVLCNKPDAYGIKRAASAKIPVIIYPHTSAPTRELYDENMASFLKSFNPDLIVLAGWMRILTKAFLNEFTVINLHPALPGQFPGTNAIKRAYDSKVERTGVMVHYVPDEGIDTGPVILSEEVIIYPDELLDELTERIHSVEHRLIVKAVKLLTGVKLTNSPFWL